MADTQLHPDVMAVKFNRNRRTSVSAEPFNPANATHQATKVVPKSNEAKMRISAATAQNLLFRNLEKDQRQEIVDAMFEKKVALGDIVIKQGDEGDNFYVVDTGSYHVIINDRKVVEIGPSGAFGELALMYNTPRAATIKCASETGILWCVDRDTFRKIVTNNAFRKRKMYEEFLKTVPILAGLSQTEIVKVADGLEPISFEDDDTIVEQGVPGDSFYIIVEGEARVTKKANPDDDSTGEEVMRLKSGDYFGELALLNDKPRAATVTAVGDCKCVCLDNQAFIRLLGPCMELLKRNTTAYAKYEHLMQQ